MNYWIGEGGIVDIGIVRIGVPAEATGVVGWVCQFIKSSCKYLLVYFGHRRR